MIPDVELARVRESADLVAIAGEHTPLKRVGRQWMAQCPFHDERTASLSINGGDGVWWCFGCQQGGDTIDFVQRIHHLDFIEAVEWLAARSGITLSRQPGQPTTDTKTRLVAITNEAATWYHRRLLDSDEARPALDYLTARGVTRALLEEFQVGWAPAGWDELVRSLEIPGEVAIAAGVAKTNRAGRLQDMFRSRITFPIRDVAGNVIGFGARRLPDGAGPKYLNSPDTSLYHKSRALYGLHRAKGHMVNTGASVVCEGYLDVLGAAAAGITNAVASCGTALGSEHLRLLARFADRVVLAFDADTAGATATARLHDLEARHNLTLFVAALPPGTDPGDLGFTAPNQLRQAIDDAVPLMTFLVDRALVGDDHTIEGRVRTANKALSVVAEHPDPLVRDQYLMVVADRLHLDSALLRDRLTEIALSRSSTAAPTPPVEAPSPIPPIEMNAIRLAAATDDRTQLWWLDPALFADPGAQRASAALRDTATVAEALEILDGAGRPVLLMAAADRQHLDDGEEVAARLVEAAVQRHIAGLDASTSDGIDRITRLRQQLQLLRPAATRAAATRAAYDLLRSA